MDIVTLLLLVIIVVLLALLAILGFSWRKMHQQFDVLLEKGGIKDFKDILLKQSDKNSGLDNQLKEVFERIKLLENTGERTLQKTAIVKFNPFNGMGGNQSFVLAFLDNQHNGFLISSLFVKEGHRMYVKDVKQGKADMLLSPEETEALEKAIKS